MPRNERAGSQDEPRTTRSRPLRAILVGTGLLAVVLGFVGVFVPILPTTPFLLLASACFLRSSPRLYRRLINHRWFGRYIRVYRHYRAISRLARITGLALLWLTIGYSVIVVVDGWGVRAVLLAVAVGVTVHLLRLRTLTPQMLADLPPANESEVGEIDVVNDREMHLWRG